MAFVPANVLLNERDKCKTRNSLHVSNRRMLQYWCVICPAILLIPFFEEVMVGKSFSSKVRLLDSHMDLFLLFSPTLSTLGCRKRDHTSVSSTL